MTPPTTEEQSGLWPAFPGQARDAQGNPVAEYADGLTKRELFAAMAMQGICANRDWVNDSPEFVAKSALLRADALLAALKETP